MSEPPFEVYADYQVPLLKLMADLPGGQGRAKDVTDQFWIRYQQRIPPDHLKKLADGRTARWAHKVAWNRHDLTTQGLMDSPTHGIWRITQAGRDWLAQNPEATRIDVPRTPRQSRSPRSRRGGPITRTPLTTPPGITLEMLEQTRRAMPPDQFRQVWGTIYDQLLAEERSKAITPITDKELLAAVRQPVRRIQDFLQGRGSDTPKSEEVCDWIHLCYTLGLYREATALWSYVLQDEVNPWQYERTKRLAAVCRTRAGM
jgi:hypothetical protein